MEKTAQHKCFDGQLAYYEHEARSTGTPMSFSVFTPPAAEAGPVPVLWWLSGLTCTPANFTDKAGAYRAAGAAGLMVVAPDTSPRGAAVPDDAAYDLGQGAGFYVDATISPWRQHFRMYEYINEELPELVAANFPMRRDAQGISGHSMGGHGALTVALKNPDRIRSISAFAPIVAPGQVPWGQKAFAAYLGDDTSAWSSYDATALMQNVGDRSAFPPILIDQGMSDDFLDEQLKPELFEAACESAKQSLILRRHPDYDHGYFFVSSFIDDHIQHHQSILSSDPQ